MNARGEAEAEAGCVLGELLIAGYVEVSSAIHTKLMPPLSWMVWPVM